MSTMPSISSDKVYDAIYVGRLIRVKRHSLASKVSNLALVAGPLYGNNIEENAPPHSYRNSEPLVPDEVCRKINQSCCGLILSEKEGACFASSEYLLSGVPVVSTYSEGGRSEWYDDYNSIVVPPDEDAVAAAVEWFVENPRDPELIRNRHIAKANVFRAEFVKIFSEFLFEYDEPPIDPFEYFSSHYFHKMRKSYAPNFSEIFN